MDMMKLVSLHSMAKSVTLDSPVEKFIELLSPLGKVDPSLISKVQAAAKLASSDPSQTIASFVNDGGLVRLLSGQGHNPDQSDVQPIECPHCSQVIFLS